MNYSEFHPLPDIDHPNLINYSVIFPKKNSKKNKMKPIKLGELCIIPQD